MDFSYNYRLINSKNIPSTKYRPYLLSNKENISNNLCPIYLSSESNIPKTKREIYSYNDVKKSLNLQISSYDNNSEDITKNMGQKLNRYSSFSSYTSIINKNLGENENNKKTLILDLDETLVHSAFSPFSRKSDLTLTINFDGEDRLLYVLKRPYVEEFLNELSSFYEIIIFTASISEYANPLLDLLDKKKCIKQRLFREHCTFDNGIYIKDLKIFDRKINNMIIIDNNPLSYDNNVSNGIPILSWYEDTNDKELLKLIPILKYMSNNEVYDVRNIINKIVDRNVNEINYDAINEILNSKSREKNNLNNNSSILIKTDYRKQNKSVEPRIKIINENNSKKYEEKPNNNYNKNKSTALKTNIVNKYENGNLKINMLNSQYNINNIYNYNFEQKSNINIDKRDPYGIRKSIFAPEEYNTSYNNVINNYNKDYHFPFNRNIYSINSGEERKDNNISKTINLQQKNNNYLFNRYSNYTLLNQNKTDRQLSTRKEEKRLNRNSINNIMNETSNKVLRTHSLVELTKKALHLNDKKEENKNNLNDSFSKTVDRNKYFNGEKRIIYNNYINKIKYINDYKSDKALLKNNDEKKYFRNYIQEYKNTDKVDDNFSRLKNHSQIISLKQINTNNNKDNKKISNNNFINNEKDKLLNRINNEKINNLLGRNYLNEGKNNEKIIPNYSQINKVSYINMIKKPFDQKKSNFVEKIFNNSNLNYPSSTSNIKSFNNKKYDILYEYKNKDVKNIISEHKSVTNLNNKVNNLINLKQIKSNKNKSYNINNLRGSSNYAKSNNTLIKSKNNFTLINNANKENDKNSININNKNVKNLNYRYDLNLIVV